MGPQKAPLQHSPGPPAVCKRLGFGTAQRGPHSTPARDFRSFLCVSPVSLTAGKLLLTTDPSPSSHPAPRCPRHPLSAHRTPLWAPPRGPAPCRPPTADPHPAPHGPPNSETRRGRKGSRPASHSPPPGALNCVQISPARVPSNPGFSSENSPQVPSLAPHPDSPHSLWDAEPTLSPPPGSPAPLGAKPGRARQPPGSLRNTKPLPRTPAPASAPHTVRPPPQKRSLEATLTRELRTSHGSLRLPSPLPPQNPLRTGSRRVSAYTQ
ncbi:PREDICTED: basic proline-rich protein-like [Chinchilla lanigera]|uniref:basic proline-rich protein-like n=1 Tax=Chinchilla lanigera TaxID=34839 RepID=UPI0006981C3F|nr:PREDICTED: basic proline-rich protein-like [Chinchilla lanigera]